MNTETLNDLLQKITDAIPEELKNASFDVKQNLRAALTSALKECHLVTREEFDAQTQVLLRTRQKLEALEKIVSEMEK